jgi:hypothetical protein
VHDSVRVRARRGAGFRHSVLDCARRTRSKAVVPLISTRGRDGDVYPRLMAGPGRITDYEESLESRWLPIMRPMHINLERGIYVGMVESR